jgi:hypothetical protein
MNNHLYDTSNLDDLKKWTKENENTPRYKDRVLKDTRNGIYNLLHYASLPKDNNYLKYLVTSKDTSITTNEMFELKDTKGESQSTKYTMEVKIPMNQDIEVIVQKEGTAPLSFKGNNPMEVIGHILAGVVPLKEVEPKKERLHYFYTFLKLLFQQLQKKHIPLWYEDNVGTRYVLEMEENDNIKLSKIKINPTS